MFAADTHAPFSEGRAAACLHTLFILADFSFTLFYLSRTLFRRYLINENARGEALTIKLQC